MRPGRAFWPIATLLLLCALYWPAAVQMARAWWGDPNSSHGLLVVPLALLLAWARRPLPQSKGGQVGAAALLGVAVLSVLAARAADVKFMQPVSLLVALGGLGLAYLGPAAMRALLFPYLFLFFAVPWPDLLVGYLSFPMQYYAACYATMLAGMLGLGVVRTGVDLRVAGYTFTVGAPCSGMRSLVALLAFAALLAYLSRGGRLRRLALFACGVPAALGANALRITVIVAIGARWGQEAAEGFFHTGSGLLVFVLAAVLLLLAARALRLHVESLPLPRLGVGQGGWLPVPAQRWPALLLAAGVAASGWLGRGAQGPPLPFDCSRLPLQVDGWQGRELARFDRQTLALLHPDAYLNREYRRGRERVQLVAVFGQRKETFHAPDFCLLGGGFNTVARGAGRLPGVGAPYRWSLLAREREYYLVAYYFLAGQEATDSLVSQQWRLVRLRLAGRPGGGALIRYLAPVEGDARRAFRAVEELARRCHPFLLDCTPRLARNLRQIEGREHYANCTGASAAGNRR